MITDQKVSETNNRESRMKFFQEEKKMSPLICNTLLPIIISHHREEDEGDNVHGCVGRGWSRMIMMIV